MSKTTTPEFYHIDLVNWVIVNKYAIERGVTWQKVNYWIKQNMIESQSFPEIRVTMVKRGSESKAAAIGLVKLPSKLPTRSKRGRISKLAATESMSLDAFFKK